MRCCKKKKDLSIIRKIILYYLNKINFLWTLENLAKGPYPLEQRTLGRRESADSRQGDTIGGQISNMFDTESRPVLQRIGRR